MQGQLHAGASPSEPLHPKSPEARHIILGAMTRSPPLASAGRPVARREMYPHRLSAKNGWSRGEQNWDCNPQASRLILKSKSRRAVSGEPGRLAWAAKGCDRSFDARSGWSDACWQASRDDRVARAVLTGGRSFESGGPRAGDLCWQWPGDRSAFPRGRRAGSRESPGKRPSLVRRDASSCAPNPPCLCRSGA